MKQFIFTLMGALAISACSTDEHTYALIETEYGTMKVMLYDTAPQHRDNFIKLAEEGYYDGLLFHRVIEGFMIQGGDPDSRDAKPSQILGLGDPGYQLDPEIGAPHIRGALAAARDNNPAKRSSGSQFYIVQGRPVDDAMLDQIEQQKGIRYNEAQRQLYKEEGGAPFLDNDYTVFGELVAGYEVLDKIAAVPTNQQARPQRDIRMEVRILR